MSREASVIVLWRFRLISLQEWKRQFCLQSNLQHSLNNTIMSACCQYLSGVNTFSPPNSHHNDCGRDSPYSMAKGMLWPAFRRLGHWLKQQWCKSQVLPKLLLLGDETYPRLFTMLWPYCHNWNGVKCSQKSLPKWSTFLKNRDLCGICQKLHLTLMNSSHLAFFPSLNKAKLQT